MAGAKKSSSLFKQRGGNIYDLEHFYKVYLEEMEPSGYMCAHKVLTEVPEYERWDEWNRLLKNTWFRYYFERWQAILGDKILAQAKQAIAEGCDPKDFPRLRWIAEGRLSGEVVPKKAVGRPRTAKVKAQEIEEEIGARRRNPNANNLLEE